MTGFSYQDYVKDKAFLEQYNAYQAKYAQQIRESDKIIIELVRKITDRNDSEGPIRLLDIGCSTGNLLLHLKRLLPGLALTGGDLAESSLDVCRANPELKGVAFKLMDLFELPEASYDIITVNAVLYMMEDAQFTAALRSMAAALVPGGTMIAFDFFHAFPHDLHIMEISSSHPEGLRLRFRPITKVKSMLAEARFKGATFRPFTLPIDLPPSGGPDDLITYTITAADGKKLPFRGTLFQPWCHLTAVRA